MTPRARLLVVDDDDSFCELLVLWLGKAYDVTVACDGQAALDRMREQVPDLALLDIMMPRMSGIELASRIRVDPLLRHTPLLFMSAYHAILESHEREAIKPWGLLSKPFTRDALASRIESILATRRDADAG